MVGSRTPSGNPTVVPRVLYASGKSAGVASVTLGALQTWVVDPTISMPRSTFPKRGTFAQART
jgi:hypothetical protein